MVLSRTVLRSREPRRVCYNFIETWETTQAADAAASRHRDEPDLLLLAGAFPLLVEPCYSTFDWWMDFSREFYTHPNSKTLHLISCEKSLLGTRRCWPRRAKRVAEAEMRGSRSPDKCQSSDQSPSAADFLPNTLDPSPDCTLGWHHA